MEERRSRRHSAAQGGWVRETAGKRAFQEELGRAENQSNSTDFFGSLSAMSRVIDRIVCEYTAVAGTGGDWKAEGESGAEWARKMMRGRCSVNELSRYRWKQKTRQADSSGALFFCPLSPSIHRWFGAVKNFFDPARNGQERYSGKPHEDEERALTRT